MAKKNSAPGVLYRFTRLTEILGTKKIKDVSRQDIIAALDTIAEGRKEGRTAKQLAGEVLTLAKRLWRFAKAREWVPVSCVEELSRRDFDSRPKKRDVTLRLDELAVILRALNNPLQCKADPVTIAALKLLILTGQRETEVTNAQWAELDLGAGVWVLPAERTKLRRAHLVHLAPEAIAIVESLKPLTGKGLYVFESPNKAGQPIYGRSVNNALATLFKRNQLPNVTRCRVHDFRRTLITRLPDLGFEPFLGHKIANHILSGVFAHYNHNTYEQQREKALKAWARRLETLAAVSKVRHLHYAA
ncbi:site-specific integrase [Nitrosospira sp. Is2]|uniref:tyrosine-type recombinase/integrase n=1 Tax=Nitrosospira sp. Is2 TaxID=3080532 RepID=UPI002953C396|nr:site-specific integrase [Nitrosospira sp. Is2]WON72876.1 site-specific integrase [Nitrosospira sp. Is2]